MNPADITVIIPAAGRVPEGLLALSNIVCPAMIPVGGRPVLHWTLTYLRSLGFRRVIIAVARPGLFVEEFVDCAFGQDSDISFMVPTRDEGVGRTIMELAEKVTTPGVLVVLGDTHFHFQTSAGDVPLPFMLDAPFVLTFPVSDSYRWCVAETDSAGLLATLHDKVPNLSAPLHALIGVYFFNDAELLRVAARDCVTTAAANGVRAELAGILSRVNAVSQIRVERAETWLDCGNADMQANAHQVLLQSRAFNEISIDPVLGTLTKRSQKSEKFIDEINYLRLLPPNLRALFPRLFNFSIDWAAPWMELEYYGYPNLSEVFLFENVDAGVWERIFSHLLVLLRDHFGQHTRPVAREAVIEMYVGKTRRRLASMNCSPALATLVAYQGDIVVNGVPVTNLASLWPAVEAAVADIATRAIGTAIHGDFCLPNILYDLRSRVCKAIDPRGSFGAVGIFGDQRYDVAKLWHSIHGHYDFVVNNLFRIDIQGLKVSLSIRANNGHRAIEERFARVFFAPGANGESPYRRRDIQL
nr:hypothetical protein [Kofleriaceae bacterium]